MMSSMSELIDLGADPGRVRRLPRDRFTPDGEAYWTLDEALDLLKLGGSRRG
jgi:hypothetical protein